MNLNPNDLNSKMVFILNKFEGACFEFLAATKATVVGPRCLISMVINDIPLPTGCKPVLNFGMRDIVVTVSEAKPEIKQDIEKKVQFMGGIYYKELNAACTHLISGSVMSHKYETAAQEGLPIMHIDWVADVWEKNLTRELPGDNKIYNKHKLPVFFKLSITSTNLAKVERDKVQQLINSNGGKYTGSFTSEDTDIVLVPRENPNSKKFSAAIQYKKLCLTPSWIEDSVEKGYAQPIEKYKVLPPIKASTPERASFAPSMATFAPDCTQLSDISAIGQSKLRQVDETAMSVDTKTAQPEPKRKTATYQKALDQLDISMVKKAGAFLDGCKIFLSGFKNADKEKLIKVLNPSGATRIDELNEQVTHVVAGDFVAADFATINSKSLG